MWWYVVGGYCTVTWALGIWFVRDHMYPPQRGLEDWDRSKAFLMFVFFPPVFLVSVVVIGFQAVAVGFRCVFESLGTLVLGR